MEEKLILEQQILRTPLNKIKDLRLIKDRIRDKEVKPEAHLEVAIKTLQPQGLPIRDKACQTKEVAQWDPLIRAHLQDKKAILLCLVFNLRVPVLHNNMVLVLTLNL